MTAAALWQEQFTLLPVDFQRGLQDWGTRQRGLARLLGHRWQQDDSTQQAVPTHRQEPAGDTSCAVPMRAPRRYDPSSGSAQALKRLMTFSRRFVRNLRVRQLPSRLDSQIIFDAMVK